MCYVDNVPSAFTPTMNLYLISQSKNNGYDTYDSAVVCASNEDEARNINPSTGKLTDWASPAYFFCDWVSRADLVRVELLGPALPTRIDAGVICASFNAT
jgi:hypothetical protein